MANSAYVLTPGDVRMIRHYVQAKYTGLTMDKHADIIANAVKRIIHKQLPDFELSLKERLTSALIRKTVLEEQKPVTADDIYKLCLELDHSQDSIAKPLHAWLREQEVRLFSASPLAGEDNNGKEEAHPKQALVIPFPVVAPPSRMNRRRSRTWVFGALSLLLISVCSLYGMLQSAASDMNTPLINPLETASAPFGMMIPMELPEAPYPNELPKELQYEAIDQHQLIAFLKSRDSMLAEPAFYDAIMEAAESFNIHPAFLFAITGQEQSFVPKSDGNAEKIANNPFNVFYSWRDYNTSIKDSAAIAARTIVRLSKNRPPGMDAFTWINREYAEDPNWANGVRAIYNKIIIETKQ